MNSRLSLCTVAAVAVVGLSFQAGPLKSASGQQRDHPLPTQYQLIKVAELSSANAPIVPSFIVSVARLRSGSFVVSYELARGAQLVLFNSVGRYVKTFDRIGEGPGELRNTPVLAASNDTVYAIEGRRVTRIDRNLQPIDTRILPYLVYARAAVLADGAVIADQRDEDGDHTYTVFNPSLSIRQTLDRSASGIHFAPRSSGGFVSLRANGQQLQFGRQDGSIERLVAFDRPLVARFDTTARRRPVNVGLSEMTGGNILVLTWTPKAIAAPTVTDDSQVIRVNELNLSRTWETSLHIVDPAGKPVAALRSSNALKVATGEHGLLYSTREIQDGHIVIDVWSVAAR